MIKSQIATKNLPDHWIFGFIWALGFVIWNLSSQTLVGSGYAGWGIKNPQSLGPSLSLTIVFSFC
jgi:hypothetical protein